MKRIIQIGGLLLSLVPASFSAAQEVNVHQIEQEVRALETQQEALICERTKLTRRADELASKITELKEQGDLNYLQRKKLEHHLQDSQDLALKIERLDGQLVAIAPELELRRARLFQAYQQEMEQILGLLEKDPPRQNLLVRLQELEQKKRDLQTKINQELPSDHNLVMMTIGNDDTPYQIQQKADFLKDQEEKLRSRALSIDKQIKQLKKELHTRERMADLVKDVHLFDQREELIGKENLPRVVESEPEIGTNSYDSRREALSAKSGEVSKFLNPISPLKSDFEEINPGNLSIPDLERLIERLEQDKQAALTTADSLKAQAELFYQEAQKRKINP
ncbi:MAG: hypothetical protein ONB05_04375 [candidate division KSB1 bacterium]|nr:hypothetical protein [candidate division KSB1 bacterium]